MKTPAIETNSLELTHAPTISHEDKKPKITHSDEKISLVLALAGGFAISISIRSDEISINVYYFFVRT